MTGTETAVNEVETRNNCASLKRDTCIGGGGDDERSVGPHHA